MIKEDKLKIGDIAKITDYVANGSFASLKENVSYNYTKNYAILVRLADFKGNWKGPFVYIDESSFKFLKKSSLEVGDLIISNVGAYAGTVFRAPNLDVPMTLGPNSIVLKELECSDFWYYYFSSLIGQHQIDSIKTGSAQPKFNKTDFRRLIVPNVPLDYQRSIASVLGALDDKIDNNNLMIETLEKIAQTIFKSWFVDFDPVKAKAARNKPSHMDLETASLFPNSFNDDGLPSGWRTSTFENLIEFKNGYAFKSKELSSVSKSNFAIFKMGHIKVGGGFNVNYKTDYLTSELSTKMEKYVLETGDILMSMTDMKDNVRLLGHTALFYEQNIKFLVNQRVGLIKAKKDVANYPYIYCLTNNAGFLHEIRKRANSGVQVNLSTEGIKKTRTIIPPISLMEKFGSLSKPMFEKIFNSTKENQILAELRNYLLPKLMSGEIHVKDAEQEVEAVL